MKTVRSLAECRAAMASLPRPLALVPTMGALHEGHLALIAAARERGAAVVVSLFVNPTQFGQGEDFATYPRNEVDDLALLTANEVDVAFAPLTADMYPPGFATAVHVGGPLTAAFEGELRPGHFDGVATVVTKLLTIVQPDVAFFGQKDAQQLAVIRRLAADLDLPTEVIDVATVREPDGLARSSRNAYLTPEQRALAPVLYRALLAGRAAAGEPATTPRDVIAAATATLTAATSAAPAAQPLAPPAENAAAPRLAIEYVAVVDAATFIAERSLGARSLLIAAVRLGATRLLDNISLAPATPGEPLTLPPISAYPDGDATA